MAKTTPTKQTFVFLQLLGYSLLLGLFAGAVTIAFIFLFEALQHLLWTTLPARLNLDPHGSLFPVVICTLGGVLVGLGIKYLGDYPETIEQALERFKKTKRFDYRHIGQAFIISIISLGFGAALGPEAALTAIIGGFVTLIGIKLHRASLLRLGTELPALQRKLLGVAAAVSGLWLFKRFGSGGNYFDLGLLPYSFQREDLVWTVVITGAGILAGLLYLQLDTRLDRSLKTLRNRSVVLTAALGGLVLGILASLQPLTLFSGHEGLSEIAGQFFVQSGVFVLLAALVKILAACVCLATGWKGGRFFPLMFAGGAIGLSLAHLLPAISPTLGLAVGMSATLAFVLRQPLVTIVLIAFFVPVSLYVPIALAAVLATRVSKKLSPTLA